MIKAEICYVNQSVAQGKKPDLKEGFVLAWHLVVNCLGKDEGSSRRSFHVWLDANTGEFIGKKKY